MSRHEESPTETGTDEIIREAEEALKAAGANEDPDLPDGVNMFGFKWGPRLDDPGCYAVFGDGECLYIGASLASAFGRAMTPGHHALRRLHEDPDAYEEVVYRFYTVPCKAEQVQEKVRKLEDWLLAWYSPKWNRTRTSTIAHVAGRARKGFKRPKAKEIPLTERTGAFERYVKGVAGLPITGEPLELPEEPCEKKV